MANNSQQINFAKTVKINLEKLPWCEKLPIASHLNRRGFLRLVKFPASQHKGKLFISALEREKSAINSDRQSGSPAFFSCGSRKRLI